MTRYFLQRKAITLMYMKMMMSSWRLKSNNPSFTNHWVPRCQNHRKEKDIK